MLHSVNMKASHRGALGTSFRPNAAFGTQENGTFPSVFFADADGCRKGSSSSEW